MHHTHGERYRVQVQEQGQPPASIVKVMAPEATINAGGETKIGNAHV
jgi:hypothetical protein